MYKMKFESREIIDLFKDVPASSPQLPNFAIAEVELGARIRFLFKEQEIFLAVSDNQIPLFLRNRYYGAVLVVRLRENHDVAITNPLLMRASAVVLSCRHDQPFITPVDQNADVIWDFDFSRAINLRKHFARVYANLLQNYPESFETEYAKLLTTDINLHLQGNGISF